MLPKDFKKLIKPKGYQIFLLACPVSLPLNIALHTWFACVKDGKISRWEVRFRKNHRHPKTGKHLHYNYLPPFTGIEVIPYIFKLLWPAKLLGYTEGSTAKAIYDFIEKTPKNYPYCDKYLLWGPNSNTYSQWVINHFPEFDITLPQRCFGKNYKIKNN